MSYIQNPKKYEIQLFDLDEYRRPAKLIDDLIDACQGGECGVVDFDTSCFNGVYVTGDIDENYLKKLEGARNDAAKAAQIKNDEIIEIHNEP